MSLREPRSLAARLRYAGFGCLVMGGGATALWLTGAPAWLFWGYLAVTGTCYMAARVLMAMHDELGRIALKVRAREPLTPYEAGVVARLQILPDDPAALDGTPLA